MELDYESLFSYRNLYLSYLKARRGKWWSDEVISYSLNLEANLHSFEKRRKRRDYPFDGYYSFSIHEPKERQIQAIHFQDRILQHCLCDFYLLPLLERHLIYDNAATRLGKGTDFARNRRKYFRNRFYLQNCSNRGYALKFDIHHFFPLSAIAAGKKRGRELLRIMIFSVIFSFISIPIMKKRKRILGFLSETSSVNAVVFFIWIK